jgi:hypothetical protein
MASDPHLAGDTCIYMEAVAGDGGSHDPNGVWWLSPDITLTGPVSGPDKADPGQNNTVEVTYHRKAATSNCTLPPGTENVTIELWVGNPSLAMAPNNPASTTLIQSIGSRPPAEGASFTEVVNWSPPQGLPAGDPQSSGHKCLVARCYPDPLTPKLDGFYVPDDQHVAQHNICIVPCGGPGAASRHGDCGLRVTTLNPDAKNPQTVRIRARFDPRPNEFVSRVVLERLKRTRGFKALARRPPRAFRLDFEDFPRASVSDKTRPGCLGALAGGSRTYEAKIEFGPGQLTHFRFGADISNASFGEAFVFHLTQIGADNRGQGGLTAVLIAV